MIGGNSLPESSASTSFSWSPWLSYFLFFKTTTDIIQLQAYGIILPITITFLAQNSNLTKRPRNLSTQVHIMNLTASIYNKNQPEISILIACLENIPLTIVGFLRLLRGGSYWLKTFPCFGLIFQMFLMASPMFIDWPLRFFCHKCSNKIKTTQQ